MKIKYFFSLYFVVCLVGSITFAQRTIYEPLELDKVEFSLTDFGRMWTFDDIPFGYWEKEYGFKPSAEWLERVQKSALQFGGGCSAAFVSADGLIMTNHHCGRDAYPGISKEGEDILRDGFIASTLEEERKIPDLFVDQLILIEDVTGEIKEAINSGKDDAEKVSNRDKKIDEIQKRYEEETGLVCEVVTLYNGGKYSLHGYKRYNDIRLVMAPDFQIASTGWDWDNFTYPRYELDFAFYRAYGEDGKPVKCDHYFNWSEKGAEDGELVFTVGRPGSTDRLLSVAQLEFFRDVFHPIRLKIFNEIYQVYYVLMQNHPDQVTTYLNRVMSWGNARKAYAGELLGLNDGYIMKKKKDFENKLIEHVKNDPALNEKYGAVWGSIKNVINESKQAWREMLAYQSLNFLRSDFNKTAMDIIKFANQMKLSEDEREDAYKGEKLNDVKNSIINAGFDVEFNKLILLAAVNFMYYALAPGNELLEKFTFGKKGEEAVNEIWNRSLLTSKEKRAALLEKSTDEILECVDPFIFLLKFIPKKLESLTPGVTEARNTLEVLNQLLGEVIFSIYGDKIPPDATSTLRISDGVLKGYEYNGTLAPSKTTFYGVYNRYYSFGKKMYPWGLHERWLNIPDGFDLSTSVGLASTNDIVGGNSGSSMINKNAEVVGLIHDGNLESLPGSTIFLPENNRAVASDAYGLIEALKYYFRADRLVNELRSGSAEK